MSRTAALLIVFFQLVYAAERRYTGASTLDATLSLILANVAIGVVFFLLTFTAAMPRYWREIAVSRLQRVAGIDDCDLAP